MDFGLGTYGSRSLAVGGSALMMAADKLIIPIQCEYYALEGISMLKTIIDQIREVEKTGIREINIMPATDHADGAFDDFAQQVMPAFR